MEDENEDIELPFTVGECSECESITPIQLFELDNELEIFLCLECKSQIEDLNAIIEVSEDELNLLGYTCDEIAILIEETIQSILINNTDDDEDFFHEETEIFI